MKNHSPLQKQRSKGFTLTEILVSVTIVSLLALLAFPAYNAFRARLLLAKVKLSRDNMITYMTDYYERKQDFTYCEGKGSFCKTSTYYEQAPFDRNLCYYLEWHAGSLRAMVMAYIVSGSHGYQMACGFTNNIPPGDPPFNGLMWPIAGYSGNIRRADQRDASGYMYGADREGCYIWGPMAATEHAGICRTQ